MLKSAWAALSPSIKNIINEAGFGTFFEALLNHKTHEYKDLQLLLALAKRFWDTTSTFHFPGIGEVMLTPYDFSAITGLRLGGKRILVSDSPTSAKLKKLLGAMTSRMKSNNIPFSWLCENIPQCETVAKGALMFMLPFIRTFLCPKSGSTVNLRYLGSLRKIEQIRNYDWGGMAYATLMHFVTQLSRRSLPSLGGAPFVWQMKLNPWAGCEGYAEYEQALKQNGHQVLFECRHGKYWYLGDQLADFLADEEIAWARDGYIIAEVEGIYSKFVRDHLQGCLVGRMPPVSEGEEKEEIPSPYYACNSSSSFTKTYLHFLAWQYDVMNPDGTVVLRVDVDLVEESMWMIGGLQSLARTQSSQYVLNNASWAHRMETTDATRRALDERIKSLELENHKYNPRFFSSQEGNTKGGSSRGGLRRSSRSSKTNFTAFKLEGIKALRNVKIKWDFLHVVVKFWDLEDHMFRFNTVELCPIIEEFSAILGYDPSKKFVAVSCDPRHKESLSNAFSLPTSITSSMIEGHMIWLIERLDMVTQPTTNNYGPSSFLSRASRQLGLEMADRVDQSFVKVHSHRMATEYSNWLIDKIVDKEAEVVAMRK
ncbi:hypothetical protein SO802_021451 [Lithocarpus litseifolius]|uniref:Aminotransferase-like plant mobile domain-containing protein n=1 Tax=Lithocarpus litseifolius TaxID=425828 RepID=A0AAW2CJV5_9ROSI